MIFAVNRVVEEIRDLHCGCQFDLRDQLMPYEPDYDAKMTEEFRRGYMAFKWAVARVLQPGRILEIGVGSGVSACAFLKACPNASYLGLDNCAMERERGGPSLTARAQELLGRFGDASVVEVDSQSLDQLYGGPYDFIHVDGDHRKDACAHDVHLAWYALADSGFLLVDDARDTAVATGTFEAINRIRGGSLDWAYFEDTWTGSILIRKEKVRE
jgi:predicted O-methyltransferase YrrM